MYLNINKAQMEAERKKEIESELKFKPQKCKICHKELR